MNRRSVKKKPPKTGRSAAIRKIAVRKAAVRKVRPGPTARKPEPIGTVPIGSIGSVPISTVTVAQVAARAQMLRSHKFRVGQTVLYTSSPIARPGASGTYQVVRLLPSDGEDYQYRIKNADEAFERVAKESQLELEH